MLEAPLVSITEEIITGKRSRQNEDDECEAHLKLALREPVGKVGTVSAAKRLAQRARQADPLCARKTGDRPSRCLACVGFTLNTNRKRGRAASEFVT